LIPFLFAIFIVCSLLAIYPPRGYDAKNFIFILIWILLIIAAGFRGGWADYTNYISRYYRVNANIEVLTEPSFTIIARFAHFIFGDPLAMFVIFAILGVSLKLIAIRQFTDLWFLSLLIYLVHFYVLHETIQMRVGVSCGFMLLSIKPIYDRNFKRFLLFFICAFLFHYTAALMFPIWFFTKKPQKLLFALVIPAGIAIYLLGINLITSAIPYEPIREKVEIYQLLQGTGRSWMDNIKVFNILYIIRIIIFYLLLWKADLLQERNKYFSIMLKIYSVGLFTFPALAIMPVMAYRVSEFFVVVEIILIPMLVYIVKPYRLAIPLILIYGLRHLFLTIKSLLTA